MVKPGRSTDGTGQTVVNGPAELAQAFQTATDALPGERIVVERYIEFDAGVTILAVRSVDPATGQLATWFCEPIGTCHANGKLVETWQPATLTEAAMDSARSIAARVTGAMNSCGVHSVELFIDGEEVYFSQATPRPTLDGMVTRATQRLDQFELHARASLRLPIDATLISPGASQLVPTEGRAVTTECLARAMAVEETGVQVLASSLLMRSTGETAEEARERAARAAAAL